MKRSIIILLLVAIISSLSLTYGAKANTVCESHVLMDYDSMTILDGKEIHKPMFPASTTKVMTAILALENGELDDIVTVDQEVVDLTYGSHIALEPGEELVLRDMLFALLLPSANDAALAIAKHISGSIDDFVQLMNNKAEEIGTQNTNFVNPNGLHDDNHVTTAYDLALIGRYAMENPEFREFVKTTEYTIPATKIKGEPRHIYTTNRLLRSTRNIELDANKVPITYQGAQGVKTGYTEEASNCLISYAERDGQRLIAVVLKSQGAQGVYVDTHKLLNHGFNNFQNVSIGSKNEFIGNVDISNGEIALVGGILEDNIVHPMKLEEVDDLDRRINLRSNLDAPIKEGEIIGIVEFYRDDEILAQGNILSTMDVDAASVLTSSTSILDILISKWYILVIIFIVLIRISVLIKRRKRRRRRRSSKSLYI